MKVRALKKHPYLGKYRMPGDVYDINKEKDFKLLVKIGIVIPVAEKPAKPATKKSEKKRNATQRTYGRKDMQAEQARPIETEPEDSPAIYADAETATTESETEE